MLQVYALLYNCHWLVMNRQSTDFRAYGTIYKYILYIHIAVNAVIKKMWCNVMLI